jgi:hypothetical protein
MNNAPTSIRLLGTVWLAASARAEGPNTTKPWQSPSGTERIC